MKTLHFLTAGLALALALAPGSARAQNTPPVSLSGKITSGPAEVFLDIYAEATVELRSFGVTVGYDAGKLSPVLIVRNDTQWFLSATPGGHRAYASNQAGGNSGSIRVVGGRFSSATPAKGVGPGGGKILLASIQFAKQGQVPGPPPGFNISLAGPAKYASFVGVNGVTHDAAVAGLGPAFPVTSATLSADTDKDGLPDDYETQTFGNLAASDGKMDSDGDGASDASEWLAGTNPKSGGSITALTLTKGPNGSQLNWTGQPGRSYCVMKSSDLTHFTPLVEGLSGGANTVQDNTSGRRGFYQLVVENPAGGR